MPPAKMTLQSRKCCKWAETKDCESIAGSASFRHFFVTPIFEDTTVYPLDAKLDVPRHPARQMTLPLPRSSLETQWTGAYHLHLNGLPDASGFFQIRNDRGEISLPSVNADRRIVIRPTTRLTSD